ncbi:MAG: M28 family peptidase [Coriobacteriales bacterium]|jgi:hypothetical protein|nr:M28 family peptidase [Coriobacteriales bacterium]
MSQLVSYAAEIVEKVGPRPAASDGEHEASKIIQERFRGLGLEAVSEEFNSPTAGNWVRALYYLIAALAAALFFFVPGLGVLALIIALVALAMLVTDLLDKNPLFNLAGRGASQNILARYVPLGDYDRRRKIVVVAHYDAGRTQLQGIKAVAGYHIIVRTVMRIAVAVVFVAILIGVLPIPGIVRQIFGVLALIAGIATVIAALLQVVNSFMPYGAGANSNASGVAALFGVAERLLGGGGETTVRRSTYSSGATDAVNAAGRRDARDGAPGTTRGDAASSARGNADDDAAAQAHDVRGRFSLSRLRSRSSGRSRAGEPATGARARRSVAAAHADSAAAEAAAGGVTAAAAGGAAAAAAAAGGATADQPANRDSAQATREFAEVGEQAVVSSALRPAVAAHPVVAAGDSLSQLAESERHYAPGLRVPDDAIRVRAPRGDAPADEVQTQDAPNKERKADASDVPDWFLSAKKKAAEREATRRGAVRDPRPIARSQFADVPLGIDTVIPSSLTRDAAQQKSEEKNALLREALRESANQSAGKKDAVEKDAATAAAATPASAATAATPQTATATTATAPAASADAPATAAAAPPATPAAAPQARSAPTAAPAPAQAASASDRPTISADLSGLDNSAFSVVSHDGASEPAIVPIIAPASSASTTLPATASKSAAAASTSQQPQSPQQPQPAPQQQPQPAPQPASQPQPEPAFQPQPAPQQQPEPAPQLEPLAALQAQLPLITDDTEHRTSSPQLANIPSLFSSESSAIPAQQPTLEKEFAPQQDYLATEDSRVSRTGSFAPLGATGAFAPVGEELLDYHGGEESIYVDDADDSALAHGAGGEGSYAPSPQITTVPDSRARSFFGSLGDRLSGRRRREELDDLPTTWLGVEDDFDARKAGGKIGSWDNFSEDDDDWKGGAFGGDSHQQNLESVATFSAEIIDHEVWLVALGSQEAENAGIKALLAAHSSELRHAMIINLDSVGAGDLCFTLSEGIFRPRKTDHRLQNLAAAASQSAAIRLDQTKFASYQTDAAAALGLGARAISLIGLDGIVPVAWRNRADTLDILDEEKIQAASELVFEMIRNS